MNSPASINSRGVTGAVSVPLLDVNRGNRLLRDKILEAVTAVCDSGRFLHGPDVKQIEESMAAISGTQFAVSCASGSDALLLALMALDIGPGDEVITPSFTFFATASCIWRLGARIVFVDIDPETYNLDPEKVEAAVTPATKAIIPVHLFGQCADMDAIRGIAALHKLHIVEDVAQAIGAEHDGRPAGSLGDVGCCSFYPTKNLGGFGDGGMLTTNNEALTAKLRLLAAHGMQPRYYHSVVGINSRLDTIQAAVLNVKLAQLSQWTNARRANAAYYTQRFAEEGLDRYVTVPHEAESRFHVWNQFTIRIPNGQRDAVRSRLAHLGIGSEVYYPVPLHLQECFSCLGYEPGSLPESERAAGEVLSLPIFPELTAEERETVVQGLNQALSRGRIAA